MTNMLEAYYVQGQEIGHGSYGCIFSGKRRQDHAPVAIKFVNVEDLGPEDQNDTFHEVMILSQIQHDYIVRFYDAFMQDNYVITCMEYISGGDLGDVISRARKDGHYINEDEIWRYAAQMCLGLQYLHDRRIVHRDLKPQNVMLDSHGNIKIADFGLGKLLGNQRMAKSIVGTPLYQSPELTSGQGGNEKVDVWAMGCIIYELAALRFVFEAKTQVELTKKIMKDPFKPIPSHFSKDLSDFIFSMLTRDMNERPTVNDLLRFPRVHEEVIKLGALDPLGEEKSHIWREMTEQLGDDKSTASQLSWLVENFAKLRIDSEAVSEAKKVDPEVKTDDILGLSRRSSAKISTIMRDIEDMREQLRHKEAELFKREAILGEREQQLEAKSLSLSARRRKLEEEYAHLPSGASPSPLKNVSSPGSGRGYESSSYVISPEDHDLKGRMDKRKLDLTKADEDEGNITVSLVDEDGRTDVAAKGDAPSTGAPAVPLSPVKQAHKKEEVDKTKKPRPSTGKTQTGHAKKSLVYIQFTSEYLGLSEIVPPATCIKAAFAWRQKNEETRRLDSAGLIDRRVVMSPKWVFSESRIFTKPLDHIIILFRGNVNTGSGASRPFYLKQMFVGYAGHSDHQKVPITPTQTLAAPAAPAEDGSRWFYVECVGDLEINEVRLDFEPNSIVEEVIVVRAKNLSDTFAEAALKM